jgi:translation initiation factor 1
MSAAVLPTSSEAFQPAGFDPFADAAEGDDSGKDYVHIRVQQRNGKKSLTTIQGLDKSFDYKKILKAFKKEFCCNGNVVEDSELGHVIQLQGDQRKNVSGFLVANKLAKKDVVKIHGF